jgi:hypothetical protein
MDWFEGVRIFFFSMPQRQSNADTYVQLAVQSALTMAAAVLGAWAAEYYHERRANSAKLERRKLLATATMLKMSMASSTLHSLRRSFFDRIPQDAQPSDYWRFVLPAVPIQDTIASFSSEEFTFLLSDNGSSDLAYLCAEVMNHTKICIAIINYYSIERRNLSDMLDQHTVDFDTTLQEVETAIDLAAFPNIRRKLLETSLLCEQMYSNITDAIANSNRAVTMFNNQIANLVGDPAFNRRLVVTDIPAR